MKTSSYFKITISIILSLGFALNKQGFTLQSNNNNGQLSTTGTISLGKTPPNIAANISQSGVISYVMPAIKGGQVTASAMIFVPKGDAPAGGWPLVVFGHDNGGISQNCAPSVQIMKTGQWRYDRQVANFLKAGIVVVVPDYEGMGPQQLGIPATGHPFLNKKSLGNAMVYAVVAAKQLMKEKLSGKWMAAGHSFGGNAALAAAEYSILATNVDSKLQYKGALVGSPLVNIEASLNNNWKNIKDEYSNHDYEGLRTMLTNDNTFIALLIHSMSISGYTVDPEDVFKPSMLNIYKKSANLCFYDLWSVINDNTNNWSEQDYPGFKYDAAINDKKLKTAISDYDVGTGKLPGKTMILQGGSDIYNNPTITINRVNEMLGKSSNVIFSYYPKADHFGVLYAPDAQAAMNTFVTELLFSPQ